MFVASLNFADDDGNLDRSARQLRAQTLPYDNIDGEPLVRELISAGLFIEYEVADKLYLHIKNFEMHQKIDRPSKSRLPAYNSSTIIRRQFDDHSTNARRALDADLDVEGKGREGRGEDLDLNTKNQSLSEAPVDNFSDNSNGGTGNRNNDFAERTKRLAKKLQT